MDGITVVKSLQIVKKFIVVPNVEAVSVKEIGAKEIIYQNCITRPSKSCQILSHYQVVKKIISPSGWVEIIQKIKLQLPQDGGLAGV